MGTSSTEKPLTRAAQRRRRAGGRTCSADAPRDALLDAEIRVVPAHRRRPFKCGGKSELTLALLMVGSARVGHRGLSACHLAATAR